MREGEKPGVNLVADMSYWTSVGMRAEVLVRGVDLQHDRLHARRSQSQELANAAKFYWGH